MTDQPSGKPNSTDIEQLPTSAGGSADVEPAGPGQSIGQVPDPDDAGVDEAGDRPGPGRGDSVTAEAVEIDTSGTTASLETTG